MNTVLLIVFPIALVITAIYETWLLRRGRGSWQALVSGILTYGGLTISTIAGQMQDGEWLRRVASIVGISALIWYMTATRGRRQREQIEVDR